MVSSGANRIHAGSASDMRPGEMRTVSIGRRAVILCCTGPGAFRAISGLCPHQGADLAKGTLQGTTLPSEAGHYLYGRQHEIVRCPWHAFEFDVVSGLSLFGEEDLRVKTYPVVVEDGDVVIVDETTRPGSGPTREVR